MKKLIFFALVLLLVGCTKEKFPMSAVNFKATDCSYVVNGDVVNFTYATNSPAGEPYKRMVYTGFCYKSSIVEYCGVEPTEKENEYISKYIWIMEATLTSGGIVYME